MARWLPPMVTMIIVIMTITITMSSAMASESSAHASSSLLNELHTWSMTRPQAIESLATQSTDDGSVLHYTISAFDVDYPLKLVRATDLFHPDYEELILSPNGEVIERRSGAHVETSCYYRGYVIGIPHSSVTMSTCNEHNDRSRVPLPSPALTHSHLAAQYERFRAQVASSSSTDDGSSSKVTLTGVIMIADASPLYIEPADSHAANLQSFTPGDHIAYRGSDYKSPNQHRCGVTEEDEAKHDHDHDHTNEAHAMPTQSSRASSASASRTILSNPSSSSSGSTMGSRFTTQAGNFQKYVELYVVNDYKRFQQRGTNTPNLSKQIINQVAVLYTNQYAFQWAYRIQIQLIGMATFSLGDAYAAPNPSSSTEIDHADLLDKFSAWQSSATTAGTLRAHDNAHLLSGYDFTGGTVGYAGVGSMCATDDSSTGITQATWDNPLQSAGTTAHEMGHNFGMRHDNQYGSIATVTQSFMLAYCNVDAASYARQIMADVSTAGIIPLKWSNCSQRYIDDWLNGVTTGKYGGSGRTQCLENQATVLWNESAVVCGDGIRGTGEQCDCGVRDCSTVDPCCDGATCQLLAGKQCSSLDPCCSSCQIATDGRVCRPSVNSDCDYADYCDGVVATCPNDYYAAAGTSCTYNVSGSPNPIGSGVCYATACLSHVQQCMIISAAQPSWNILTVCNGAGDTAGNTGCSATLSCSGQANGAGSCSHDYDFGNGFIYAPDGTPCNTGMQCYNKACVASSSLPTVVTDATWRLTNWSSCSHPCGGTYTRTISCKRGTNTTVPDSWCTQPPPATSSACSDTTACSARVTWNITSSWTPCSSSTCSGTRTRTVVCADTITIGTTWSDASCAVTATKPVSSQACNTNLTCSSSSSSSTGGTTTGQQSQISSTADFGIEEVVSILNKKIVGDFTVAYLLIVVAALLVLMCLCALIRACCCQPERQRVHDTQTATRGGPRKHAYQQQ